MKSGFGIAGLNNGNLRTDFSSAFAVFWAAADRIACFPTRISENV